MSGSYDSRPDTNEHIATVRHFMAAVIDDLRGRAECHDASKLFEPEVSVFDEYTPKLKDSTYGSDEYKAFLGAMGPGLQHHYEVNDHHPEHNEQKWEWREVKGFDGRYSISSTGAVRSNARLVERDSPRGDYQAQERRLRAQVTPKGYARIQLGRDGRSANRLVHRLVAEAFIPNPDDRPEVNHKDGNKLNNCVENLEWATASENLIHAYDNGLRDGAVKYVVHCPELDLTTLGCPRMEDELRTRGYTRARASGIWAAMDRGGKHLDLTFEGASLAEHLNAGIHEMSLVQMLEMLCDWKAATLRHDDGDLERSIRQNADRFDYGDEIRELLLNTAQAFGWLS